MSVLIDQSVRRRWIVAAVLLTTLTVSSGIVGFALWFAHPLVSASFDGITTALSGILIGMMFPLMLLVAHCLDRLDEAEKAARGSEKQ